MSYPLLDFYKTGIWDHKQRTLREYWSWGEFQLEYTHDYIQWMFPLKQKSQFQPQIPVLTDEEIELFSNTPQCVNSLRRSYLRMLDFYGFDRYVTGEVFRNPLKWRFNSLNWLDHSGNHNFLRQSRILRSLKILGLPGESEQFLKALLEVANENIVVPKKTVEFWQLTQE